VQACVLLEGLGLAEHVDRLLEDEKAMARLRDHADDRLKGPDNGG